MGREVQKCAMYANCNAAVNGADLPEKQRCGELITTDAELK